jgi:SAM-dependent methyltransferase
MDWEARYLADDMPWEKGAPAPPLVDWLARNQIPGLVLVPGCGSGHDVRELARAGAEPIGIDIAPSAITRAESLPRAGSERYRVENLFALPPELTGVFDWAFEHTCFCAIDPKRRADYAAAIAAALKPHGRLLAIFYLDPGHAHPGDGPPFGVTRAELDTLFTPQFETLEEYVPSIAYPGREGRELVRVMRRR